MLGLRRRSQRATRRLFERKLWGGRRAWRGAGTHGRGLGRRSRAVPSVGGSLPAPLPLSPADSGSRSRPHRPHQTHSGRRSFQLWSEPG
ncbi:hypothetical protein PAHAL_2G423900 [Panicum hallii]|uniref:Uncharacterized protein n=1 Tax=Panicum hallii TaxID=206008 RepID=A0A2T8KSJ3_9POAL|nr:hypothetical protein PAHAL_2G423900 [Panicum hallii]